MLKNTIHLCYLKAENNDVMAVTVTVVTAYSIVVRPHIACPHRNIYINEIVRLKYALKLEQNEIPRSQESLEGKKKHFFSIEI